MQIPKSLKEQVTARRKERLSNLEKRITAKDELCSECVQFYKLKCKGAMSPMCNASIDIDVREKLALPDLSDSDKNLYAAFVDPVAWAKLMFNWEARWYQARLLHCNSQKRVVRWGRRSGKTASLSVDALHKAATRRDSKILIICPFQDQVDIVFQAIRDFISKSEELSDSVSRDVHNPHRIEFHNGSFIMGITAGVRTGMKGQKTRGQDATDIYLDEADLLDRETLEAMLAIFASRANCRMWASGTPTGQRSFFFEYCSEKEALDYKEFHYPSSVSPTWTPEIEMYFRQIYSEAGYMHEFDAEFGEEEAGIYQNQHIDASLSEYSLIGYTRNTAKGFLYSLGVDWNAARNGVRLLGVEYNPQTLKMTVCLKESLEYQEFTQNKAVERIIRLHEMWNFDAIYVDEGYGSVQCEQLRLYGQAHPRSRLGDLVKGIKMKANLIIKDPFTGQDQKKNAKHLMVEVSARRVESGQCTLPKSEDRKGGLVKQMRDFRAEKISRDGIPVYSGGEDHDLVAWQLAILGLILEFTDLARPRYGSRVAFADVYHMHKSKVPGQEIRSDKKKKKSIGIMPRSAAIDTRGRTLREAHGRLPKRKYDPEVRRPGLGGGRGMPSRRGRTTF